MFCEKCGHQIPDDALFCENCGAAFEPGAPETPSPAEPAAAPEAPAAEIPDEERTGTAQAVTVGGSGDITLCPDGVYRWYYEYPMLKNPVVLFTVWKVLLLAAAVPAIVVFLSDLSDGFFRALGHTLGVYALIAAICFVLSLLGYFILAATYGFKYIVLFEMDESGLLHTHIREQRDKARVMGHLAAALSVAQGSFGGVLAGLSAGRKSSSSSSFSVVSSVKGRRRRNVIYVNELLSRNHVYVADEDYDFVYNFIVEHCPKAKVK